MATLTAHSFAYETSKQANNMQLTPIAVAHGDGIGSEIMTAVLNILKAADAPIAIETIDIGEKAYHAGHTSGIPNAAWDILTRTKILLKAPITTPQGSGYKSLNVTMRKVLGLYANVRPCVTYAPYVPTNHPSTDLVIIRENEEDLYAGIEHQQTDEVIQCLKLVSKPGTEKIIRYAFEFARAHGRKKVTCMTKDNIMKHTDGLFHKMFDQIGKEYPEIAQEHYIIDIGAARIATHPERFDVIVTLNLYGDIISDIAAEVTGSIGMAGSANIGDDFALFEAIHGSAPDIAGKDIANPSGLLSAAVQMLIHIGKGDVAESIQNAWLCTLEEGIHTADIFNPDSSLRRVGTQAFADAVIERLGRQPKSLKPADFSNANKRIEVKIAPPQYLTQKELIGVDVFLHHRDRNAFALGDMLKDLKFGNMELTLITNRGVKVFPDGNPATFCTDHWRCRFKSPELKPSAFKDVLNLLSKINVKGFDIIKTEHLYTFDGVPSFTLGQGQ
jgi:isocitrate dehydrogenase